MMPGSSADNRFFIGIDGRGAADQAPPCRMLRCGSRWFRFSRQLTRIGRTGFGPTSWGSISGFSPGFLYDLPGGTYVLGHTVRDALGLEEDHGPVEQRPGHDNDVWRYWSDDGLGLLNTFFWLRILAQRPSLASIPGLSGGRPVPRGGHGAFRPGRGGPDRICDRTGYEHLGSQARRRSPSRTVRNPDHQDWQQYVFFFLFRFEPRRYLKFGFFFFFFFFFFFLVAYCSVLNSITVALEQNE